MENIFTESFENYDISVIPCFLKINNDSIHDYELYFYISSPKNQLELVYLNYSKNSFYNESLWVIDKKVSDFIIYESHNLISFTSKFINDEIDNTFIDIDIPDSLIEIINLKIVKELDEYLYLDPESQQYYTVKDEIFNQRSKSGVYQKNNFQFSELFFKTVRIRLNMDEKQLLKKIKSQSNIHSLAELISIFSNNKLFLIKAIKEKPEVIKYCDEIIFDDKVFTKKVITGNPDSYLYFNDKQKNDLEIIWLVLNIRPVLLKDVPELYKSNRDIVLLAVNNLGSSLQYASEDLKNDIEIVTAALTNTGTSIHYASESFKSNIELILIGVKNNASMLMYIDQSLMLDRNFILKCADLNGRILKFVNESFKNDIEIITKCLMNKREAVSFIPSHLLNDPIILEILGQ